MKKSPLNTEREENPILPICEGMVFGSEGAILRQEAAGQQSLVASDTLPTECRGREALEAAGVKFLEEVPGDPLFCYVELPTGWKKVPTDHSMWSHLVDEKGRKRAGIFYKAASYDRKAYLSAERLREEEEESA